MRTIDTDKPVSRNFLYIAALLLAVAGIFELLPAIKEAQRYISKENFENFDLSCKELLSDRPWYGRINHWFFTWIVLTPALVFSVSPGAPSWLRGGRVIFAALACYGLMNLAVHLQWDIRNAPFRGHSYPPGTENGYRMDCHNIADGFSLVFALMYGWIPACVYTVICLRSWNYYHSKFSKKLQQGHKSDVVSRIFCFCFKIYSIPLLAVLLAIAVQNFSDIKIPSLGAVYLLTLRPLLIPIEIFVY